MDFLPELNNQRTFLKYQKLLMLNTEIKVCISALVVSVRVWRGYVWNYIYVFTPAAAQSHVLNGLMHYHDSISIYASFRMKIYSTTIIIICGTNFRSEI